MKEAKWPCFICGEETYSVEGHGVSPRVCLDCIRKLWRRLKQLGLNLSWDEDGYTLGWEDAKWLVSLSKRDSDYYTTRIIIDDKELFRRKGIWT